MILCLYRYCKPHCRALSSLLCILKATAHFPDSFPQRKNVNALKSGSGRPCRPWQADKPQPSPCGIYRKKHYPDSKEADDLISIGIIGLIRAAETFDYRKNISFSTYAGKCINNQIRMYFRKTKHQQTEVYMNDPMDCDKDGNAVTLADISRTERTLPRRPLLTLSLIKCTDI